MHSDKSVIMLAVPHTGSSYHNSAVLTAVSCVSTGSSVLFCKMLEDSLCPLRNGLEDLDSAGPSTDAG